MLPSLLICTVADRCYQFRQLRQAFKKEVRTSPCQSGERVRRCQVSPRLRNRRYGSIAALVPHLLAMPARSLGDKHELLAGERMKRVGDPNPPGCR